MSTVCDREPCDIKHDNIQYDTLWVYFHPERKFKMISRSDYPKPKGTLCELCPPPLKENKTLTNCFTKVETWTSFKSHLPTVERIFAEKIAFPGIFKESDLPDVSNYNLKYRRIGQLGDHLYGTSFYIFDIQENKFIYLKRDEIGRKYTKNGMCNYCTCPRKMASPATFLSHIQALENRYFCYLILEGPNQNDRRNQEKINNFVEKLKGESNLSSNSREIREFLEQQQSFSNNSKLNYFEENFNKKEDEDQSSEYLSINGDSNGEYYDKMDKSYSNNYTLQDDLDNPLMLVNVIENIFKNDCRKFSNYFNQLRSKVNISSLDESLINSQEQLILNKNDQNLETKEKNLSFNKDLNLDAEDLSLLFSKHGVPESFKIKNISLTLNLNLKLKDNNTIDNQLNISLNQFNSNLSTENNEKRPQRAKRSIPFKKMTQSANDNLNDNLNDRSIENNEPVAKKMFI